MKEEKYDVSSIPSVKDPLKILVVDDESDVEGMVRLKYRKEIRKGKYEFLFAENGKEALNLLNERDDIGIVISDINMPEMDGLTLLDKVGDLDKMMKTIIVSAYGDMDNIRTAMNRGAYDFITKPIDFEDLTKTIEKTRGNLEEVVENLIALNQAEISLKESNARNRAIINSALDSIITIDSDGIIESANPASKNVFGYIPDELTGKHITILIPELENKNDTGEVTLLPDFAGERKELTAYKESGEKFQIEMSISDINLGNRILYNAIISDITIRKRAEYLLKEFNSALEKEANERNKDLIKLNNEKNEILGIAAHDLKNPLSNIKMLAKLILDDSNLSKQEIEEFSTDILTTTERMSELIKNLLDINRIEQGNISLEKECFSAEEVLEELLNYCRDSAKQKDIQIYFDAMENGQYNIMADRRAFSQVMENLISNAIKYSPFGKNIIISIKKDYGAVIFNVQDEGPGISEGDQSRLFQKFARLSSIPTGGENSTGLGLSIVKKLTEMMNGSVWCDSKLGEGSTFSVSFPDC